MTTLINQTQPAGDGLAKLFTRMSPRRRVLLGVLELCREPRAAQEVAAYVNEAQQANRSVYSAGAILSLLEEAGGISRVSAEGCPRGCEPVEPEHVVVDGVEYLRTARPTPLFWKTSEAGLRVLADDRPLERAEALFEDDTAYLPVYKTALELCCQDAGMSAAQLGHAIDGLDLVQEPRLFASHFMERLERAGAVEWHDAWHTTDIGLQALNMLTDVQAA